MLQPWPESTLGVAPGAMHAHFDPKTLDRRKSSSVRSKVEAWIVDDDDFYRESLFHVLNFSETVQCTETFSDCSALLRRLDAQGPAADVILLDVHFPGFNGIQAIGQVKRRRPEAYVVMLTISSKQHDVVQSLHEGADGYLVKASNGEEIVRSILEVVNGASPVDPHALRGFLESVRAGAQPANGYSLTAREREILRLMADDITTQEIADRLWLSHHTLETHSKNIFRKLGCHSRTAAVAKALRERLI